MTTFIKMIKKTHILQLYLNYEPTFQIEKVFKMIDPSIHSLRLIQFRVTRGHKPIPVAIWQVGIHPGQGCLSIAGLKRNYELMIDNITK